HSFGHQDRGLLAQLLKGNAPQGQHPQLRQDLLLPDALLQRPLRHFEAVERIRWCFNDRLFRQPTLLPRKLPPYRPSRGLSSYFFQAQMRPILACGARSQPRWGRNRSAAWKYVRAWATTSLSVG